MHWLRAAPRGTRAGLAVATTGGITLQILVLPKVWRDGRPVQWVVPEPAEGARAVVLVSVHEGDWIQFPDAFGAHVAQLSAHAARDPTRPADRSESAPLLAREYAPPAALSVPVPDAPRFHHDGLLALALLAHRADPAGESVGVASSPLGGDVEGVNQADEQAASPVGALLLAWSLARSVESRLRDVRRGYTPHEEWRTTVRGRLLVAGLVRHLVTDLPDLLCADEEFTEAIPLYRIIVAGLQEGLQIAGHGAFVATPTGRMISFDLMRLRRHLGHVRPYGRSEAIVAARRLRLPRLMQTWAPVVRTCLRVLQHEVPSVSPGDTSEAVVQSWVVNMPRLWELLLLDSLRSAAGGEASVWDGNASSPGYTCASPWLGMGNQKRPDIVLFRDPGGVMVADAKYKPADATLDLSDQYQLFAYSHLVRVDQQKPLAVAVVRPGPVGRKLYNRGTGDEGPGSSRIADAHHTPEAADRPPQLSDMQLPFPGPGAAMSEGAWRQALEDMRAGWSDWLNLSP